MSVIYRNIKVYLVGWWGEETIAFKKAIIFPYYEVSEDSITVEDGIVIGRTLDDKVVIGVAMNGEYVAIEELDEEDIENLRYIIGSRFDDMSDKVREVLGNDEDN